MALEQNAYPIPSPPRPTLNRNPMLPSAPLGAATDSIYEAESAQAKAQTQKLYNDVLRLLGYMDPETGRMIPGTVELDAMRARDRLNYDKRMAGENVKENSIRAGNMFSGRFGTRTARAQNPMVQALADLDIQVPRQLSALYEEANNIIGGFNTQQNLLLAQAAARAADRARNAPAAAPPLGSTPDGSAPLGGGGSPAPTPQLGVDYGANSFYQPVVPEATPQLGVDYGANSFYQPVVKKPAPVTLSGGGTRMVAM